MLVCRAACNSHEVVFDGHNNAVATNLTSGSEPLLPTLCHPLPGQARMCLPLHVSPHQEWPLLYPHLHTRHTACVNICTPQSQCGCPLNQGIYSSMPGAIWTWKSSGTQLTMENHAKYHTSKVASFKVQPNHSC